MPNKSWFYQLNHGVVYFVQFKYGQLALTSRVNQYEDDNHLIRVSILAQRTIEGDAIDFVAHVEYAYKDGHGRSRNIVTRLNEPSLRDGKHILGGLIPIDIGPAYVILEFTCDVGSYFGDYSFKADTADDCL